MSALREAGLYRENLPHTSDFEMWMRLAVHHDVGRVNGPFQGFYREHASSMSRTVHGGVFTDVSERLRALDSVLSEYTAMLPDASRMSDVAHRAIAREALSHAISAFARGITEQEPVDDYMALASKTWHNADRLREWRVVSRLNSAEKITLPGRTSLTVGEALRNLRYRLLWRRWNWTGV
jgi:hypothetical protein